MSNYKRVEFNETDQKLLQFTAGDLIPQLSANPDLIHVRQSAFDYYDKERNEHYQVQITVTRSENDFLDFMQTEEMSNYQP